MNKLFTLLTATICVAIIATFAVAETKGPDEIKFTPKFGTVTFNHVAHQGRADCATCHHTGDYTQCKSCHGVDENAPKSKVAFHNLCKDCHKESQKGPNKCKECHIK
ncbi:Class III cytochrome C family protein [Desulfuromusa kysingii]|uniref:Class III cytochrome C family protein n=1 Tax=Desulfuromusa kysingii TaxID=37625 RepID=A0A1H3YR27_9BACT|nr:cytochrome c3 family protein [Desulfuromusa kysingii]SEA14019.1 Class III cytochrome C family protein [Desulfuromusa kysingii]